MENKRLLWFGAGCAVVCILAAGAFFVFGTGAIAWLISVQPDDIEYSVDHPGQANSGEKLSIKISITNTADTAQQLSSIDFSMYYLEGFVVDHTTPAARDLFPYEGFGTDERFLAYSFNEPIPAGETLLVEFFVEAVQAGDYAGVISICINSEYTCVTTAARTVVQ